MRKLFLFFLVIVPFVFYSSCSKDRTPAPDCVQADTLNTYTKSVKPIFDLYCAPGCHDASFANSQIRLDTYENAMSAARNDVKFFCVIDWSCAPLMPNTGVKLADSLITKIQAWKANCYAE